MKTEDKRTIKFLIVDDHAGVRQMIQDLVVVGDDEVRQCDNGDDAVRLAAEFAPDCVTLDVRMPGLNAFEAARAIRVAHPTTRVVVVTSCDVKDFREAAFAAGVSAYVVKDDLAELPRVVSRMFGRTYS